MSVRAIAWRHGRQNASSNAADNPIRKAVTPSTPTRGNSSFANAAPRFCDSSDAAIIRTGSAAWPAARSARPLTARSTEAIARHRDAAEEIALVVRPRRGLPFGRAERHHQRQQVLLARVRETSGGRAIPLRERA